MINANQHISKTELEAILGSRVSLDPDRGQKRIMKKEINDTVVMQQILFRNSIVYVQDLVFDECVFNEAVNIGEYQNAGKIIFLNCVFNKSVQVEFRNSSFSGGCVFNDNLNIQIINVNEVNISNYNVKKTFEINGTTRKLVLENINEANNIEDQILNVNVSTSELSLKNVRGKLIEFQSKIENNKSALIENDEVFELIIGKIVLNTILNIYNSKINQLKIGNVTGSIRELVISDSSLEEIKFSINALNKLSIKGGVINNLELFNANQQESILNIEKVVITNVKFYEVFNNGKITLRELTTASGGTVSFKSSNLGKTDFIYCNFSKAILEFENSKITEAFFSETEFPKKVLVNGKINYKQAQLTFGQLATAFQKQGDNIRALEYSSRELEAHYNSIKWISSNFFQKFNLWLNAISNSFGRNWIRGVIFSLTIGLLFFCLLLISSDQYQFGIPCIDWNILPAFFKFMNPLRFYELEDLFKNTPKEKIIQLNWCSYLADFSGRIFLAYAYYQTIQAFRRFGRK